MNWQDLGNRLSTQTDWDIKGPSMPRVRGEERVGLHGNGPTLMCRMASALWTYYSDPGDVFAGTHTLERRA